MNKIDYSHELSFWKNHLAQKDHFKEQLIKLLNSNKRKSVFPKIILNNFKRIMSNKEKIFVLDVGCGPTSSLAWAVDKKYFKVKGIDPLAKEYRKIMKSKGYKYPINPEEGFGEEIIKKFGKNIFDLTYSRNSLDHTKSSIKTFDEMVKSTKKEGFICIEFMKFEGTHARWVGIHNHNLEVKGKNLIHYDKKGKKTILNLGKNLRFVDKLIVGRKIGDWQSILFQKI